jgi:hypothetical protein
MMQPTKADSYSMGGGGGGAAGGNTDAAPVAQVREWGKERGAASIDLINRSIGQMIGWSVDGSMVTVALANRQSHPPTFTPTDTPLDSKTPQTKAMEEARVVPQQPSASSGIGGPTGGAAAAEGAPAPAVSTTTNLAAAGAPGGRESSCACLFGWGGLRRIEGLQ